MPYFVCHLLSVPLRDYRMQRYVFFFQRIGLAESNSVKTDSEKKKMSSEKDFFET